jgi:hypothetical protein
MPSSSHLLSTTRHGTRIIRPMPPVRNSA